MRPALLLVSVLAFAAPASASEVFTVPTLSQARQAAGGESTDKLIVVWLTKTGDADSDFMAREAWAMTEVKAWVQAYAVAAKVDAYSGHGANLRSTYRIERVPATLVFRGETLVRRQDGAMDGDKLLTWLEVARTGEVATADALLTETAAPASDRRAVDVEARLQGALDAPNPEAAASLMLAVWNETAGTPQQDERRPRITEALRPYLISADAAERVRRERDAAWARHKKGKQLADLLDWMALNAVLEEDAATVRWLDEVAGDPKGRERIAEILLHPQDPLLHLMTRKALWAQLGGAIRDPLRVVQVRRATYKATKISITGAESSADKDIHLRELGAIVAGLLAAQRDKEAREVADLIASLDKLAGPRLVEVCLDARQPRRWLRAYLDPSQSSQVELALRLTQAIEGL
jgi:hypothetical protein